MAEKQENIAPVQDAAQAESLAEGKVNDAAEDIVHAAEAEFTPEQYRKLLWKIDLVILPLMWICSGVQYADKVSISTQATFGLREDTHLVGQQYSWLSSIFYIAFLVAELPGNYILQRFNLGKIVATCMFIWGVLVLCIAFAKNFADLMVLRVLQGLAESTTYPALLIMTASWYTTREHAMRLIVWGTANAGMDVLTSLINYGIGRRAEADGAGGLAPWKGISLFLGALTILLSAVVYLVFSTPRDCRWLGPEERRMAQARVVASQTGSDAQHRRWDAHQIRVAFRDPQTYFFFFVSLVNSIPNGGLTAFGNLVYTGFGFSALDTIVKGKIPQQLLSITWFIIAGNITMRKQGMRFYFMLISIVPSFAGLIALALLPKDQDGLLWTRWGCYFITILGNIASPLMWTLLPSNVAGRTKKSVTSTLLLVAYCAGNCIGAQVFQAKDAPTYIPAIVVCATMYGVEFVSMVAWRFYYQRENKKRAALIAEMGLTEEESAHQGRLNAESDMTDVENIHFKYSI